MKYAINLLAIGVIILNLYGCFAIQRGDEYKNLAPGSWRGLFLFGEDSLAEKVPVNFEVTNSDGKIILEFLNGKNRIKADSLRFWGDTIYAWFDNHKKYIKVISEPGLIEGYWFDSEKKEYPIEFYAKYGQKHRFIDLRIPPKHDINGIWAMDILDENEDIIPANLKIETNKNKVFASFKTERDSIPTELEGTIQNEKLFLSAFTGERIIFMKAELKDSLTLYHGSIRYNFKELACSAKRVKSE